MTYPFAGEIKMTKVIKDGKEVIEWERVDLTYHADGNVGIGTPPQVKSAPLVMGEPVERMRISEMVHAPTPPPRQWQGLTDEDVDEVERWVEFKEEGSGRIPNQKLVRYIEAKLKAKNS